ncbi:MAG: PDZ domain-containing protein [Proteobacteria bacterium]|nr:PDZ domain-containing protein [Pseudomonadota bacterium]
MQKKSIIIALVFLFTGFLTAYFIFGQQTPGNINSNSQNGGATSAKNIFSSNPFVTKEGHTDDDERLDYLENEITLIKQQLHEINLTLQDLPQAAVTSPAISRPAANNRNRFSSALTQRLYSLDNLIRGGIEPSLAEDIVRRKNSIELKRLALQDLATRDNYLNTQRYYDELSEINEQDVTLREELGDQQYDEYLFASKQNNRIRIASVMLGSAAEQAGITKGDVVLSYNDTRMFTWQELKDATSEGQLGEYVSISIYRDGDIYSFSVPRGPLGMQLGSTRLEP